MERARQDIDRELRRAQIRRDAIKADLGLIILLAEDTHLIRTFDEEYLSRIILALTLIINPAYRTDRESLQTTLEVLAQLGFHLLEGRLRIQDEMSRRGGGEESI